MIDLRDAIFDEIYDIALKDKDVIFINADAMAHSLEKFARDFPERYINVGVSEQNMVLLSSGLAMSGKKVFIYALAPFITLRCFELIKANICSMNLPITIIGGGVGFSFGYDGPTHHAVCDIAVMRTLPELTIYNPSDYHNIICCIRDCYQSKIPNYIRLDKGNFPILSRSDNDDGFSRIRYFGGTCIISTGIMTHTAVKIAEELKQRNLNVSIIDLYRIKPINIDLLCKELSEFNNIITLEENSIIGGIGSIIAEIICDFNLNIKLKRIAIKDEQSFIYGEREWMHEQYGIDYKSVAKIIMEI